MKKKWIIANAPIFNLTSALSTLLLLCLKFTSTLTAITTLSNFLLINKLSNNNTKNIGVKNIQEQEYKEKVLEFAACILVLCAGPPRI